MEKNLYKIFEKAEYCPECHLSERIFNLIEHKSTQVTKRKRMFYVVLGVLSLSGSIFSIKTLVEQSSRLGLYDYLSLAFSDSGVIATYWKEYILTIADSLPILSIVVSFALLFVLFVSIRHISYQFKASKLAV